MYLCAIFNGYYITCVFLQKKNNGFMIAKKRELKIRLFLIFKDFGIMVYIECQLVPVKWFFNRNLILYEIVLTAYEWTI